MWPRLVANKILKKRLLGSNNFVADFPSDSDQFLLENTTTTTTTSSDFSQPSLSFDNTIFNHNKEVHKYKFFVSTWNVGGIEPHEDLNIEDWVDLSCDVHVFGFQEIVPLKAKNVLGSENSRKISMKWNSLIRKALNKKVKHCFRGKNKEDKDDGQIMQNYFQCVISKQMVGILISVWVRSSLRPFIKHPSVSCVGCGIMGCLGNKGSVSVRFLVHETSFCFVCSHLASGGRQGDEKYRNSNVTEILSRTSFSRGPLLDLPQKILDHE
ncbi:Type I inositol-1,4,5-trisphosphate 5-phosphatase CVP2 [Morus notabilis]|uniref:Type I inositol-1,4,5-trisphosphate 5-phosphatase CVP2 n=1 Tax=Morus notabilis TaxID=981085 RepID=W9S2B6_9ROSA|nr:Type I inositol-1,4,5-trisphosphate 5-phosphatase CVP2 [Morus notabilis]